MSDIRVTKEQIDELVDKAKIEVSKIGDKTTLVYMTLECGFVFVESSSCVDPANYDEEIGKQCCIDRIKEYLWKYEGYYLQKKLFENSKN